MRRNSSRIALLVGFAAVALADDGTKILDVQSAAHAAQELAESSAARAETTSSELRAFPESAKFLSKLADGSIQPVPANHTMNAIESEVNAAADELPTYFKGFTHPEINVTEFSSAQDASPERYKELAAQMREAAAELVSSLRAHTATVVSNLVRVAEALQQQIEQKTRSTFTSIAAGGADLAEDGIHLKAAADRIAVEQNTANTAKLKTIPHTQGKELLVLDGGECKGPLTGYTIENDDAKAENEADETAEKLNDQVKEATRKKADETASDAEKTTDRPPNVHNEPAVTTVDGPDGRSVDNESQGAKCVLNTAAPSAAADAAAQGIRTIHMMDKDSVPHDFKNPELPPTGEEVVAQPQRRAL